jgi:hypothetical protein
MSQTTAHPAAGSFPTEHRTLKPQTACCFRVDEWFRRPAATVEIRRHGTYVRTARVDAATEDSRLLWLSPEGVDSRVLIDKLDVYEVWTNPEQPHDPRQHR